MILGVMLVKATDDAQRALGSLKACCDDVFVNVDDTPGRWSVPEWQLRQPLVAEAARRKADWAISLDADEWLTDPVALRQRLIAATPGTASVWLRRYNLWGNGMLKMDWQCRVWRPQDGHIIERRWVGTASCPNSVCSEGHCDHLAAHRCAIVHEGYKTPDERARKALEYMKVDPLGLQIRRDMQHYLNSITDAIPVPDHLEPLLWPPDPTSAKAGRTPPPPRS